MPLVYQFIEYKQNWSFYKIIMLNIWQIHKQIVSKKYPNIRMEYRQSKIK